MNTGNYKTSAPGRFLHMVRGAAARGAGYFRASPVRAVKLAAVAALAVAALSYTTYIASSDVALVVYIGDERVGAVADTSVVRKAMYEVKSDIDEIVLTPSAMCEVTYELARVRAGEGGFVTYGEIYNKIYDRTMCAYTSAFGLFVDGSFICANESSEVFGSIIASIAESVEKQSNSAARISSDIEIKQALYATDRLRAGEEIFSLLADGLSYAVTLENTAAEESTVSLSADNDKAFAPNLTADTAPLLTNVTGNSSILSTTESLSEAKTEITVTVTEDIPYGTVYEPDTDSYVGTYTKKQDGTNGKKTVVYTVGYSNGVEVSRAVVAERIITEPVDKVLLEGTKTVPSTASTGVYAYPVKDKYQISSYYGWRVLDGVDDFHIGVDFASRRGTPIYASDGGEVVLAKYNGTYGNCIIIKHDNGYETLYGHLSKIDVTVGERVYQGQKIGEMGSTGKSTGDHLHFEVRLNNKRFNPLDYLGEK